MDRFFIPRMGIMAVLGLATLLIGVIVLRNPDTHTNLWNRAEGYSRTPVGVVAAEGQTAVVEAGVPPPSAAFFPPTLWLTVAEGGAVGHITDPGQRLYIVSGCAKCHGMDGRGGVVGSPLAGLDPQVITALARIGPRGMPAFSPDMLSDSELADIGAYLSSLKPVTAAEAPPAPAATPEATAAPTPGAAPLPTSHLATPQPTPASAESTPVATPSPAPGVVVTGGDAVKGKTLYLGKCAACHGQGAGGGGYGPSLFGLGWEVTKEAVRQGKGRMPALGTGIVSDQDLQDILAYIHSLAPTGGGQK